MKVEKNYTELLRKKLLCNGADLVGFGNLTELPQNIRKGFPIGIVVAIKFPKDVIRGIYNLPTPEYYMQYNLINSRLDSLVEYGAECLLRDGFSAIPQTLTYVRQFENDYFTLLPHKTIATRAGIGWIGKCSLLITEKFGSMVRLSSILTNAPLETAHPVNQSRCGDCKICSDECPAGAISGYQWSVGVDRDELLDVVACRKIASERALKGFGIEDAICGKCIMVCPYTKQYLQYF